MSTRVATFFESAARTLAVALVVALLATVGLWYALQRGTQRTVTAYFPTTVGLYEANTVDVQGVPVGQIEEIVPEGRVVRVVMKVDNEVPVPADAQAVIVAPTLVSDRYVQLGPPYAGGPMMSDGAIIPPERTASPVEVDRVYQSLNMLGTALGPNGANRTGAFDQLLRSSANALGGNGALLKSTTTELAGAVGTLSDNRQNLFATVDNLGQFTNTLARNDGQVRAINAQLQDISAFLAAERGDLSRVLQVLPRALADVARFVRDNRDVLRADVGQLAGITDILVRQQAALTEIADLGPLGLGNLTNVYNASSGTLDVRPIMFTDLDPNALLCGLLNQPQLAGPGGALGGLTGPMAEQAAGAQTVCAASLDPESLAEALAPIQTLRNELEGGGLPGITPSSPGAAPLPSGSPGPGVAGGPTPGGVAPNSGAAPAPPGTSEVPRPGAGILGETLGGP